MEPIETTSGLVQFNVRYKGLGMSFFCNNFKHFIHIALCIKEVFSKKKALSLEVNNGMIIANGSTTCEEEEDSLLGAC